MRNYKPKRDVPDTYFPVPKCIFRIGLASGEILVYAYLMYCEDRKTFQCYPSYSTIGQAVGMSNNTVKKHVDGLRKKGMITTEYTTVKTQDGRVHNGSLLYTLLPIEPIEEAYFQKMLRLQRAKKTVASRLKKYNKKSRKGVSNETINV